MFRNLLILGLALTTIVAVAQPKRPTEFYVPGADYPTLHKAMTEYYAAKGKQRGGGYKQFRRWEWFVGQRVDSTGFIPNGHYLKRELDRANLQKAFRSDGDWTAVGPIGAPNSIGGAGRGIGRLTGLAFHPTDSNTMWVGAPAGGLWKTIDNGAHWENLTPDWPNLGVGDLVINPLYPDTMYLASGDGSVSDTYSYGLLRSPDGGNTWENTGLSFSIPAGINFRKLALDPLQPHIVLAATNNGLMRSVDAGASFNTVATGHFTDAQWMPFQSDTVFASTYDGSTAKLYRSTDNGVTWTVSPGLPGNNAERVKVRISPAAPRRVYAVVSNSQSGFRGLWRSDDAGESFQPMANTPNLFGWDADGADADGTAWYAMDIAVSYVNPDIVVVGSVSPWISTDGGVTFWPYGHWSGDSAPYVHADQHRLMFHPITDRYFSANDGGLFRKAWTFNGFDVLSNGMNITQFYKMSHGGEDPDRMLAGAQDNGTHRLLNGTWTIVHGGDGMEALIDPTDGNIMYCTTQNGTFHRSTDAGFSFSEDLRPSGIEGQWVTPFLLDPDGEPVIYAAWHNVIYRSDDYGSSWFEFSPVLAGGDVSQMAIAPLNHDLMYVATRSRVHKTTDLGGNWSNISTGLPTNLTYTGLAINHFDPNVIWLTVSGYTDGKKVYRSSNGGGTWQNMSLNLPNLPANCVVMEKSPEGGVYVGTDAGVYYWQEGATEWIPFMNNLPNVIVNDMEVHDGAQKLRIATYGRGIWESPLMHGFSASLAENATNAKLQIYPNPTSQSITISTQNMKRGDVLLVANSYGEQVSQVKVTGDRTAFDATGLSSGTYYLMSANKKGPIGRFVVAR